MREHACDKLDVPHCPGHCDLFPLSCQLWFGFHFTVSRQFVILGFLISLRRYGFRRELLGISISSTQKRSCIGYCLFESDSNRTVEEGIQHIQLEITTRSN